jgi:hypothetical protein
MYSKTPKTTIASALTWALRVAHNKGVPFTSNVVSKILEALDDEPYPKYLDVNLQDTITSVLDLQDKIQGLKKEQAALIQDCIHTLKDYNQNLPRKRTPPCQ